jgi:hypothetical protein
VANQKLEGISSSIDLFLISHFYFFIQEVLMTKNNFPPLSLAEWRPTLNTLQMYLKVMGKVRRALTPRHKHWWHISLYVNATGLTTSPIPAGAITFEMLLDLTTHKLVIATSSGEQWQKPIYGQSPAAFCDEVLAALAGMGVTPDIDRALFSDATPGVYDKQAVERYWQAISQIDAIFKQFKGELRQETGPVQLWPHHADLALLWFSGRLVPGVDPADEENADEQMNFGFSSGDDSIPNPYFYVTAYPRPDGLTDTPLPAEAYWHTQGFTGAILMYEALVTPGDPKEKLLTFLRAAQQAGAKLMK